MARNMINAQKWRGLKRKVQIEDVGLLAERGVLADFGPEFNGTQVVSLPQWGQNSVWLSASNS